MTTNVCVKYFDIFFSYFVVNGVWFSASGSRSGESLLNVRPVNDLEDTLDVVGPDVLVLEVVGVLPDVDAQQGY